jgi:transcriptional regulator with XRE-family HTH domain
MFNDWLLNQLKQQDWSQADLARASGLTTAAISRYISGRTPDEAALRKIAKALRLPPELVFEKAGLLPTKSELTPKKRELMARLEDADEATVQMVIKILEAAVEAQHRQVPGNLNPKTTPR